MTFASTRFAKPTAFLLAFTALATASPAPGLAGERTATSRDISDVVELFTSQGCSSCPPADALLTRYSRQDGMLALAYHVDYWDYIGWQDVFGSRKNTERQRSYAARFETGSIYTPQMVVNGQRDVVGSRRPEIEKALAETGAGEASGEAKVELHVDGKRLRVRAAAPATGDPDQMPVLMLVTFDDESRTAISRGENAGAEALNSHSVRDWRALGVVSAKPMEVDIPVSMLVDPDGRRTGCAVFLQAVSPSGAPGAILAAATLEFGD